jgi:outer membrane protein OmpA-like peptidoglycan-associated protein
VPPAPRRPSPQVKTTGWFAGLAALAVGLLAPHPSDAAGTKAPAGTALKIQVDKSKVDLRNHRLEVKLSRPAGKVKIVVTSESDAVLADEEQDFSGRPAGMPLIVTWNPSSDAPVAKIDLRAFDSSGAWVGVELAPWFVAIPHEDVNFRTGSAEIDEPEAPKLEAAYGKLEEVLAKDAAHGRMHPGITLFIAGHTDTVGTPAHNLTLSQDRARSIAAWFRKRGVKLPISYEGFGESSPAVKTADNVDEIKNRRADYVLSDGPPIYSAAFKPSWKRIP